MMTTESERSYDIGNKGYLTKFERQLKELDDEVNILDVEEPSDDNHLHNKQQRRFSTTPSVVSDEFMDESDQNYKNYLSKVQRDFQEVELQRKDSFRNFLNNNNNNNNNNVTGMTTGTGSDTHKETHSLTGMFRTATSSVDYGNVVPPTCGPVRSSVMKAATVALVVTLWLCNAVFSGLAWTAVMTQSHWSVDSSGRMVTTTAEDGKTITVTTMASGFTMELPVIMPTTSSGSTSNDISHPYACVGLEGAVNLWTLTKRGIPTNVVLTKAETSNNDGGRHHHSEYGISLTFQGATQNETHACLPTHNTDETLCIDFVSDRCGDGNYDSNLGNDDNDDEDDDDDDKEIDDPGKDRAGTPSTSTSEADNDMDLHHARRLDLFQRLTKKDSSHTQPFLRRHDRTLVEERECHDKYGNWCREFASIVLIGTV